MDILQAKKEVVAAGIRLVENGLIARTWGNVSCRVDENSFVITPSGKPYLTLQPDDIVLVSINTLAYSSDVKPSSEKGVHAEVYKAHPEANFVIHTHQPNASVISSLESGIPSLTGEFAEIIGSEVLISGYGLPGTKTLKKGVSDALAASKSKAVIMAHHGAVCFGKDSDDAFNVAATLEKACEEYVLAKAADGSASFDEFCKKAAAGATDALKYDSTLADGKVTFTADGETAVVELASGKAVLGTVPAEAKMHLDIYKNTDFTCILACNSDAAVAVSSKGETLKPTIDDFAQIVGPKILCTDGTGCAKAIKGKNAVLIKGKGALCCGKNEGDANAVKMIMSKNCLVLLGASLFGKVETIGDFDSLLMRYVYLLKYSKKAE